MDNEFFHDGYVLWIFISMRLMYRGSNYALFNLSTLRVDKLYQHF